MLMCLAQVYWEHWAARWISPGENMKGHWELPSKTFPSFGGFCSEETSSDLVSLLNQDERYRPLPTVVNEDWRTEMPLFVTAF